MFTLRRRATSDELQATYSLLIYFLVVFIVSRQIQICSFKDSCGSQLQSALCMLYVFLAFAIKKFPQTKLETVFRAYWEHCVLDMILFCTNIGKNTILLDEIVKCIFLFCIDIFICCLIFFILKPYFVFLLHCCSLSVSTISRCSLSPVAYHLSLVVWVW